MKLKDCAKENNNLSVLYTVSLLGSDKMSVLVEECIRFTNYKVNL